jgi:integral membrane protein (TIGR00529 family)
LNPSLALLISIAAILVLIRLKAPIALGVLAGCVLLIAFVIPLEEVPNLLLKTIADKQTWQLLIIVPCTMAFSSLMEQKGLLNRLATTLEHIGPKLAIHALPVVIGLVPMPAGALVAATAVNKLSEKLKLTRERIAFTNYWFRHIWEYSLPFYPAIVVTSTVLGIPIATIVRTLFPMTFVAIALGVAANYRTMREIPPAEKTTREPVKNILLGLVKTAWPILLLVILIFAQVPAWIAFPGVLVLIIIQQKVNGAEMEVAFKYGFNPQIILMLLAVMLYQMTAKDSNAASFLITDMKAIGLPPILMLAGLPLLIGAAIGYGPAIAGIALPLLLPYIIDSSGIHTTALLVASASGMIGQMLSPAHLCFCLSVEYFQTTMGKVYRYTVPLLIIMEFTVIAAYLFFK